ncbi:hypothetical protein MNEG_7602, partial [Monoraphidium neglectum]
PAARRRSRSGRRGRAPQGRGPPARAVASQVLLPRPRRQAGRRPRQQPVRGCGAAAGHSGRVRGGLGHTRLPPPSQALEQPGRQEAAAWRRLADAVPPLGAGRRRVALALAALGAGGSSRLGRRGGCRRVRRAQVGAGLCEELPADCRGRSEIPGPAGRRRRAADARRRGRGGDGGAAAQEVAPEHEDLAEL